MERIPVGHGTQDRGRFTTLRMTTGKVTDCEQIVNQLWLPCGEFVALAPHVAPVGKASALERHCTRFRPLGRINYCVVGPLHHLARLSMVHPRRRRATGPAPHGSCICYAT